MLLHVARTVACKRTASDRQRQGQLSRQRAVRTSLSMSICLMCNRVVNPGLLRLRAVCKAGACPGPHVETRKGSAPARRH